MWPRFEDGEPVWFGDSYIDTDGDENTVCGVILDEACADLIGMEGFHTGFDEGESVKRTAPGAADSWESLFHDACGDLDAESEPDLREFIRRAKRIAGMVEP